METDEFNEEGDEIATIEYQNIESEGITALTRQLEAQTSLTYNDNDNETEVFQNDNNTTNENDEVTTRNISQDTVLHCDSITYDVLCALAGTNNLGGVRNFTMRVRCPGPQDTIQRLPRLMPFISALYLDNSSFYNFRIFGEEVSTLKILSVNNCGISELHGVDFLVGLKELYAANNAISNVLDLSELHHLAVVDLENNEVDTFDSVSFLFLSPKLHTVTFRGNPIASDPEYRDRMMRYLPRLKTLDPMTRFKKMVVEEQCKPVRQESSSPDEDDSFTDIQMKLPEPESDHMSEDEAPPVVTESKQNAETEDLFQKFKENEGTFVEEVIEDTSMFGDIEDEEERRNERKEAMSTESFEMTDDVEDDSCQSNSSDPHPPVDDGSGTGDGVERTFCCKKHRSLFMQSSNSIRLCATKQLFEQISCDDPDIENENEERDKKLWENMAMLDRDKKVWSKDDLTSGSKIVGRRVDVGEKQEYQLHEADIKGKLLSRRSRQDPLKMKMIETSENEIEEMAIPSPSSRCLPVMVQNGSRSAFEKRNSKEDQHPEQDGSQDVWQLPGSSSSTPRPGSSSSNNSGTLFRQGKGRPSTGHTRPGSSTSLVSIGGDETGAGNDSGVEIPNSPGGESKGFTNLPKVKTKDELLMMLNKIKVDGDNETKSEDL